MSERVDLEQLEALERAATPGPWRAHTFEIDCPCPNGAHCGDYHTCEEVEAPQEYPDGQCVVQISVPGLETFAKPNAEFIAAMRNALPELIRELRVARADFAEADEERGVAMAMRNNERARIVAWLRRDSTRDTEPTAWDYADAIEHGEHLK